MRYLHAIRLKTQLQEFHFLRENQFKCFVRFFASLMVKIDVKSIFCFDFMFL